MKAIHLHNLERPHSASAAATTSSTGTVLLAPTIELLMTSTRLKAKRKKDRLAALPYALEEKLATPVADQHFVTANTMVEDDQITVGIVSRKTLIDWLAVASHCQIDLSAIVPDVLAIPWSEGDWSLVDDGEQILVRTAIDRGFAVDCEQAAELLHWQLHDLQINSPAAADSDSSADTPTFQLKGNLRIWRRTKAKTLDATDTAKLGRHFQRGLREEGEFDDRGEFLAKHYLQRADSTPLLNLLTDDYRTTRGSSSKIKSGWLSAGISFTAVVVYVAALTIDISRADKVAAQAQQRAETQFRETFPGVTRIVDLDAQTRQQLQLASNSSSSGEDTFTAQFIPVALAIEKVSQLTIEAIEFRTGQLRLTVAANDMSTVEQYRSTLENAGLRAQVDSVAGQADGTILGQITVVK